MEPGTLVTHPTWGQGIVRTAPLIRLFHISDDTQYVEFLSPPSFHYVSRRMLTRFVATVATEFKPYSLSVSTGAKFVQRN